MKRIICFLIILFLSDVALAESKNEMANDKNPQLVFDKEVYFYSWADKSGTMKEYIRKEERLNNWTKMITKHNYTGTTFKDIWAPIEAYLKNAKPYLALEPELFRATESKMKEDIVLILVLVTADKKNYEYIIARFYQNKESNMGAIIFSWRLPYAEKMDFTDVMKSRQRLIGQLMAIKL